MEQFWMTSLFGSIRKLIWDRYYLIELNPETYEYKVIDEANDATTLVEKHEIGNGMIITTNPDLEEYCYLADLDEYEKEEFMLLDEKNYKLFKKFPEDKERIEKHKHFVLFNPIWQTHAKLLDHNGSLFKLRMDGGDLVYIQKFYLGPPILP